MKKILIIDDDKDFAESISTFLDLHGYTTLHAQDGTEGVKLAASEKPDAIICDIMMKERTEGFFTIQELRRTPGLEKTPIVVASSVYAAVPAFTTQPDAGWLAHDDFIAKPIDPDALLRKIEEVTA